MTILTGTRCLVHATAVAVGNRAALIIGPSGAGKSDLALRAIMTPLRDGAETIMVSLVADDQVVIERVADRLIASAPPAIAGKLEVRGLGILPFAFAPAVAIHLVVRLMPASQIERLPDFCERHTILGVSLPVVAIDGGAAGAPARLVLALLRTGVIEQSS